MTAKSLAWPFLLALLVVPVPSSGQTAFPGFSNTHCFHSVDDLWEHMRESNTDFYDSVAHHYQSQDAGMAAMAGDDPTLSIMDLKESATFLQPFLENMKRANEKRRALDAGAGIGRVTDLLLSPHFDTIDVIEPMPHFIDALKVRMEKHTPSKVDIILMSTLQAVTLLAGVRYDLIVVYWVLEALKDSDFVAFLIKCKDALAPGGAIFAKGNVILEDAWYLCDKPSLHRNVPHYQELFRQAGLAEVQPGQQQIEWNAGWLPLQMFLLAPLAVSPEI